MLIAYTPFPFMGSVINCIKEKKKINCIKEKRKHFQSLHTHPHILKKDIQKRSFTVQCRQLNKQHRLLGYWIYRVSIKSFPDYKHLLQMFTWTCWNFMLHLRRVSAADNFPTRWRTSTLGLTCLSVFGCNISKQVDWERWSDTLATTIAGYHPP